VGAKALLHIGLCYEKLGLREAQQAYQGVISNYPEAAQEVAVARQRLASLTRALAELEQEPRFRKLRIASNPDNGVLSPDGSKLAFVSDGSVWVVPVQGNVAPDMAGEPVRITEPTEAWNAWNQLAWSGDGEWIAFNAGEQADQIYVVPAAGGEPQKVPGDHFRGGHAHNFRLSLAPDGRTLAFVYQDPEDEADCASGSISTYSLEEGAATRLVPACASQPAFSPDGEYVAYIKTIAVDDPESGNLHKQLWVMPAAGGTHVLLIDSVRVRSPVWSPDGTKIAVLRALQASDFSREVWIVRFAPEEERGLLARVGLPTRTVSLLAGWTPENELGVHLVSPQHYAVYTVPVTGGQAVQVSADGFAWYPRWSPDGRTIVYNTVLHRDGDGWVPTAPSVLDTLARETARRIRSGEDSDYFMGLAALPAGGGRPSPIRIRSDTRVQPGIPPGGGVHVSPDGERVVFTGALIGPGQGGVDVWTLPVEGGEPTRLAISPTQDRYPCWSADGESVAFLRGEQKAKGEFAFNIHVVPAQGGEPVPLTSDADGVEYASIAYSPDGKWLAYFSNKTLRVMPVEGGESRVVTEVDVVHRHTELSWSPDSDRIAFTGRGSIWVVPVAGGEPEEVRTGVLGKDAENLHIAWSPDGKKIVFSASHGGDAELWLISDFLPEER
jgi:Tol biopolymer transport system component